MKTDNDPYNTQLHPPRPSLHPVHALATAHLHRYNHTIIHAAIKRPTRMYPFGWWSIVDVTDAWEPQPEPKMISIRLYIIKLGILRKTKVLMMKFKRHENNKQNIHTHTKNTKQTNKLIGIEEITKQKNLLSQIVFKSSFIFYFGQHIYIFSDWGGRVKWLI